MKKALALLLATLLCLCSVAALAEDAVEVPVVEDGTWVPFADYNVQICLPSDWNVLEITEEQTASGIIFSTANPEMTRSFTLAYNELEAASDIATIGEQLAANEAMSDVQILNINGMDYVTYTIAENDVVGLVTLGGSGIGLYQFVFYPASDADYASLALQIAASISTIE